MKIWTFWHYRFENQKQEEIKSWKFRNKKHCVARMVQKKKPWCVLEFQGPYSSRPQHAGIKGMWTENEVKSFRGGVAVLSSQPYASSTHNNSESCRRHQSVYCIHMLLEWYCNDYQHNSSDHLNLDQSSIVVRLRCSKNMDQTAT